MLLGILVVVDAHEEDVARIFGQLGRIVFPLDLLDGGIGGLVELQLNDKGWLVDITTGNHHQVGIPLARSVLTMDDVLVLGPDIGDGKHTGKRVFIVVSENAGMLIMSQINALSHSLLVAGEGGNQKVL